METKRRFKSTLATKQRGTAKETSIVTHTVIRKYGKHMIELTKILETSPVIVEPLTKPKTYTVRKSTRLIANIFKKSDIEFISRYGRDLLGE
jgi:hypothetical protein